MAKLNIGYFLEDIAQENFVKALVTRIALEMGFFTEELNHDVRNATGGKGVTITEFQRFLRDVKRGQAHSFNVLVVAIDGNCQGYQEKRNEIKKIAQRTDYRGKLVCVIPDPHIERWYLIDPKAFCQAIKTDFSPEVRKCCIRL